jgi:hypothetical protein
LPALAGLDDPAPEPPIMTGNANEFNRVRGLKVENGSGDPRVRSDALLLIRVLRRLLVGADFGRRAPEPHDHQSG